MGRSSLLWSFLAVVCGHISAYCLYGDELGCAFQCHCAVASECGNVTSTCPSGCATAPLGHDWMGPGCQIGNVGLYKTAQQTGKWGNFIADNALDGFIGQGNTNCAHPHAPEGKKAEWWTDLVAMYKIFNITIYGRTDAKQERLQEFVLSIYNTTKSVNERCAYQKDIIYTNKTIECTSPVLGKFVRFKRKKGPELRDVTLCEVVITGHLYIDCSLCPNGVNCNDIIGCDACDGAYQPECVTRCEQGSYGTNCAQTCGRCKAGTTCDIQSGYCPDGCQPKYFGHNCTEECEGYCKTKTGCHDNGDCMAGCESGYYGTKCTQPCNSNCVDGICDEIGDCTNGCDQGFYGTKCSMQCSTNCAGHTCNETGDCTNGCDQGFYGTKCSTQCSTNCRYGNCGSNGDCMDGCTDGYYGSNCTSVCSQNCKADSVCDDENGVCLGGCELWYIGNKCTLFVGVPNRSDEVTSPEQLSSSYITVRWQHLRGISSELEKFYFYSIQHKADQSIDTYAANTGLLDYTEVGVVSYSDAPIWNLTGLDFNTNYLVVIIPFREVDGKKDYGAPYPVIYVKTDCVEPDKPRILDVRSVESSHEITELTVIFEAANTVKPNCQAISKASLHYKTTTSEHFLVKHLQISDVNVTVVPSERGSYQFHILVENNEGYKSTSNMYITEVSGPLSGNQDPPVGIIAGSVVSVVVIIVVVIVLVLLLLRRRRIGKPRVSIPNHDRTMTENDNVEIAINHEKKTGEVSRARMAVSETIELEVKSNKINNPEVGKLNLEGPTSSNVVEDEDENMYANSGVAVINFEGYVVRRKANMKELYDEYRSLPQEDLDRCNDARTETNKLKNRYKNIFAYDETRVNLDGEEGKEYINANYITGYNKAKEYIATQGTKKGTIESFWRMMWQERANRIVMVANVDENGKRRIDPYWPDNTGETVDIGDFTITTESLEETADYTTRIMSISKMNETRTVHQFHFTTWEDKNKPVYGPMSLLSFCNKVHSFDKFKKGPLVVHCSAGIGRTGTFIALDILQQMATTDKSLDIYNCVKRLRYERMTMVQTKEQYVFLHDVLVDFIKFGTKAYECQEFLKQFETIRNPDPDPGLMLRIQHEFQLISGSDVSHNPMRDGLQSGNVDKNRNKNIIPDDTQRLFISGKQNYINAVYVDSFKAHDAYVVTQTPLPHTIADFWQLVIEQKCHAIVMLNQVKNGDQTSLYWPDEMEQPQTYRHVQVELLSVDKNNVDGAVVIRDFKVTTIPQTKLSEPVIQTVRHFQLLSWPQSSDLPENRGHILDLMNLLQSWQQQHKRSADKWKTLIHCLDGGSHSGMFCGASYVLDRMKVEQDVDAILAVRYVTRRRPEFFTKLIEYQFLYQMAVECMTKYNNIYENFQ